MTHNHNRLSFAVLASNAANRGRGVGIDSIGTAGACIEIGIDAAPANDSGVDTGIDAPATAGIGGRIGIDDVRA
ncbi:hypothetical protein AB9F38_34400, partial [Rhizobium leguminosarum]